MINSLYSYWAKLSSIKNKKSFLSVLSDFTDRKVLFILPLARLLRSGPD